MNLIKGSSQDAHKKTAIIVGVLFIIGTVAGVLSVVFTGSILGDPDYLIKISENQYSIILGALFVLIMGFALAMVPVVIFPVIKKHNEILALGYVVFRGALESFTYIGIVISWLLLVRVGQEYVTAGITNAPYFLTLGNLLREAANMSATMTSIVFPLGAMMLYVVFYQTKLIPRWLSIWGLIGVLLHLVMTGLAGMFVTTGGPASMIQDVLNLPIFLQEMVMAVWLIVRGFKPSAIAARDTPTDMSQGYNK